MAALVERLGFGAELEWLPTSNSYYAGQIYRLSTPLDLLRFRRIGLFDRFRLGLLYLKTLFVNDWKPLETITAREWLIRMAGENVYHAVWEPLLRSKFGAYADEVAAVWIWNKLKLRGSSRGKKQEERLGYVRGGFGQVLQAWERELRLLGVRIELNAPVTRVVLENDHAVGVEVHGELQRFDAVLVTTAPEVLCDLTPDLPADYAERLRSIRYLANICLVMRLDRSLSKTYWLNVGEPDIPFTGVIEHTNMQPRERYGGAHLAYISRYLTAEDPMFAATPEEVLQSYLPYLQRMFRGFEPSWVRELWAWRERYTQPVIGLNYSERIPPFRTPVEGLWLSCMAQVYPEDRGMNYAVVFGRKAAEQMLAAER
ncbi:MAG: NAD(P)/FAD-dependent oxidoreductase, partial [Chloroflexi bacterium]|nr:NAD(P)/FAD-dependent oxidoreductase [Chloroflexota bacterium]